MRPCGACVALVPADTGCPHWRPKQDQRSAEFQRLRHEKTKNRMKEDRARENARQAVADFQRQMGVT